MALHFERATERDKRHVVRDDQLFFHYTTPAGFLGILRSGSLWASHAESLNDSSELLYGAQLISEVINVLRSKENESSFTHMLLSNLARHMNEIQRTGRHIGSDVYLSCFCEAGDLLSQWRGYAGRGTGYALGFDLRQCIKNFGTTVLGRVTYDRDAQIRMVTDEIESALPIARATMGDNSDVADATRHLASALGQYVLEFKHPAFAEEKEWRLIQIKPYSLHNDSSYELRPAEHMIVPYVTIELRNEGSPLPIRKIIVGPGLGAAAANGARAALRKYGYRFVAVESSAIPLR